MTSAPSLEVVIGRGFTRDDMLFLGYLCDITPLARETGYRCPVALSRTVVQQADVMAGRLGISPQQAYSRILRQCHPFLRGASTNGPLELQVMHPFRVDGLPSDLLLHVAAPQENQSVSGVILTIYTMSEQPAYV